MKNKSFPSKTDSRMENQTVLAGGHYIVSGEKIQIHPLPDMGLPGDFPSRNRFPTLLEVERSYVQKVLAHVNGNRAKAAELLGINRVSLWRKLKKFAEIPSSGRPQLEG